MRFTCPACNETLTLAALLEHEAAREAISLALKMPAPLGKFLLQYLGFFKPAKSALSLDKVARILGELLPMIAAGKVSKNGTIYAAPQEYWAQAIETMMANRAALTLPLKSHGYLISIIAGYAEKVEAKAEKQAEQGRRYGEIKTNIPPASSTQSQPQNAEVGSRQAKTLNQATPQEWDAASAKARKAMPAEVQKTLRKMTGKASHAE